MGAKNVQVQIEIEVSDEDKDKCAEICDFLDEYAKRCLLFQKRLTIAINNPDEIEATRCQECVLAPEV